MSHSQFHSTNLFILRHAWLNLWDKHMTTGRINQVTTIQIAQCRATPCTRANKSTFHDGCLLLGFRCLVILFTTEHDFSTEVYSLIARPANKSPCTSISQISGSFLPVFEKTEIMTFEEDYQQPAKLLKEAAQSRRILEWLVAIDRFSHRQLIHTFLHCRQKSQTDIIWQVRVVVWKSQQYPCKHPLFQPSTSRETGTSID